MKSVTVPEQLKEGPWTRLLLQAFRLIDDFQIKGGLSDPFWTLGGGTVLMETLNKSPFCGEPAQLCDAGPGKSRA